MPRRKGSKNVKTYSKMPKRRRTQNSSKKETQIIKTRLIEISMKIEEYIYHKTPISVSEAEMFIREVNSYKVTCSADERSLQVIEKLTRCMKAIIAEHQEQRGYTMCDEDPYLDDNRTNVSSPVYSLPDEDRTQLTQTPNIESSITKAKDFNTKKYDIVQVTRTTHDKTDTSNRVANVLEIKKSDDEKDSIPITKDLLKPAVLSKTNEDANIRNTLSILSIRHLEERMDTNECSQSILNNYQVINNTQQNNTNTIGFTNDIAINNGKIVANLNNTPQNQQSRTTVALTDSAKAVKPIGIKLNNNNVTSASERHNLNHPLVAKVSKAIKNTFTNANIEKDHTIATNNIVQQDDALTTNNNINVDNKTYNSYKAHGTDLKIPIILNKTSRNQDSDVNSPIVTNKRTRRKKLTADKTRNNGKLAMENLIEKSHSFVNHNNTKETAAKKKITRKKNNVSIPIYNKNVVNDLSWLENIRYVREIDEDEYGSTLTDLNESFWENYLLPPNFDEKDFLL